MMSLAIKIFTLFLFLLLVESCTARYIPADLYTDEVYEGRRVLKLSDVSKWRYIGIFRWKMEALQREADKKYPLWKSTNYLDRSFFLSEKAEDYVQLWDKRRKSQISGNPYRDLRNNVHGDLWPKHYDYCRQSEGTNLLTYMLYDFCRKSEGANLLKYMTYGLSPEVDIYALVP